MNPCCELMDGSYPFILMLATLVGLTMKGGFQKVLMPVISAALCGHMAQRGGEFPHTTTPPASVIVGCIKS